MLADPGSRARAAGENCVGPTSASLPAPKPARRPLLFGLYPGGPAGQIVGGPQAPKPEDPAKVDAALAQLRGGRPLVVHLYMNFGEGADPDTAAYLGKQAQTARRFIRRGLLAEYVVRYRPPGDADVEGYVRFLRRVVAAVGRTPGLKALQITNEVNNTASPDASDGAYPGARRALVEGVIAAKEEAMRLGLGHLEIGFNWFYRLDPSTEGSFWTDIGQLGGKRFAEALDWVGVDAYPGTFFTPPGADRRNAMVNALGVLRECFMPVAGIPESVEIHVTENGWPTAPPARSYAEQEIALREMLGAVHAYRGNYNVTDYRWFDLRDADTSSPNFQQQYGLLRDDYSPKPAFGAYRELIASFGLPAEHPRIRLRIRPRRAAAGRVTRFRIRATAPRVGMPVPVEGALVRFAGRKARTNARGLARLRARLCGRKARRARAFKRGYRPGRAGSRPTRGAAGRRRCARSRRPPTG